MPLQKPKPSPAPDTGGGLGYLGPLSTMMGGASGLGDIGSRMERPMGKSVAREHQPVVGKRTPGLTRIGGGDQALHSANHYGKKGFGGMSGGSL